MAKTADNPNNPSLHPGIFVSGILIAVLLVMTFTLASSFPTLPGGKFIAPTEPTGEKELCCATWSTSANAYVIPSNPADYTSCALVPAGNPACLNCASGNHRFCQAAGAPYRSSNPVTIIAGPFMLVTLGITGILSIF